VTAEHPDEEVGRDQSARIAQDETADPVGVVRSAEDGGGAADGVAEEDHVPQIQGLQEAAHQRGVAPCARGLGFAGAVALARPVEGDEGEGSAPSLGQAIEVPGAVSCRVEADDRRPRPAAPDDQGKAADLEGLHERWMGDRGVHEVI